VVRLTSRDAEGPENLERVREAGYSAMRLDTVPGDLRPVALYRPPGFVEIEPYRPNPVTGALVFELTP